MATCPYLELVLLPGGLGRYHTYTCCNTPSLLILCSILFNLPSAAAKFFELPFFPPHLLLFIFSQAWGQPVQPLHPCAWVVLAHQGSHAQSSAFGFALLARGSVRRRAAGRSGWERLCLPLPSDWAPGSNSFPSNIFPSCCQTYPDRGNESALLHSLPAVRNQTVSPTPKCLFCISERLSNSSRP